MEVVSKDIHHCRTNETTSLHYELLVVRMFN